MALLQQNSLRRYLFDDSTINDASDPSENSNRRHQIEILNLNSHFDPIRPIVYGT